MNILGIETSCDETSAAVVCDGRRILSNVVATSLKEHEKYGGVIPEIASRRQLESIAAVVEESLTAAQLSLKEIDAVAVTHEPGLIGSLLVGISFGRALSFAIRRPLIYVNHIHAHLYASFLQLVVEESGRPELPVVGLVVSGGHTSLYHIRSFKKFELLGQTRDDAAGEAYDKVARILNLGYPGGPVIDRLAASSPAGGLKFSPAKLGDSLDFSFSGIKTAILYYTQKNPEAVKEPGRIAGAFQESVVDVLVAKSLKACESKKVKFLVVGGGVAANSWLRQCLTTEAEKKGIKAFFPPVSLCMDNAAMIAGLGYHQGKW